MTDEERFIQWMKIFIGIIGLIVLISIAVKL